MPKCGRSAAPFLHSNLDFNYDRLPSLEIPVKICPSEK